MSDGEAEREWEAAIRADASRIYVREQVDGRWQSVALVELPPERQQHWIRRWWQEGREPVRLPEEHE